MFRIKQIATTVHRTLPAAQTLPTPAPQTPKSHEVLIRFKDGRTGIYDKSQLQDFTIPMSSVEIELSSLDQDDFDTLLDLFVENQCLHDILPPEAYSNPCLFEDIQRCMQTFWGKDLDLVTDLIKNYQIKYFTLDQALCILKGYEKHPQNGTEPLAVKEARTIVSKAKLFDSVDEAKKHFRDCQETAKELSLCVYLRTKLQADHDACLNPVHKSQLAIRVAGLEKQIQFCKGELAKAEDKFAPAKMSMMTKETLQKYLESDEVYLKTLAEAVKEDLCKYKQNIRNALEKCGADMTRTDLLEYVIGPKAFLLDYYGMPLSSGHSAQFPFRCGHGYSGYRFENDGPYALETEMRQDLSQQHGLSRGRLITKEEVTRPVKNEVVEMGKTILPFLEKFSPTNAETRWGSPLHQEVTAMLWKYNQWETLKVAVDDIHICEVEKKGDIYHVKGHVMVGTYEKSRKLPIYFDTTDYILLVPATPEYPTTPDKVTTANTIKHYN